MPTTAPLKVVLDPDDELAAILAAEFDAQLARIVASQIDNLAPTRHGDTELLVLAAIDGAREMPQVIRRELEVFRRRGS